MTTERITIEQPELTIEHIAPYAPFGLEMNFIIRGEVQKTGKLNHITHNTFETHPTKLCIEGMYELEHIWMFQPILRPLSSLTKEITHNNETFVPIEKIGQQLGFTLNKYEADGETFYGWDEKGMDDVQGFTFGWDSNSMTFGIWFDSQEGSPISTVGGYKEVQMLLSYHIDIFNLIPKNLAVKYEH